MSAHGVTRHRDIAQFLDHLAQLRSPGGNDHPGERAAFLTRKAGLLTRIADQHAGSDPAYSEPARQLATNAYIAAGRCSSRLQHQRVGPNDRRTADRLPDPGGGQITRETWGQFWLTQPL
jgi:hypothetical protein